jgi:AmmeMemoRadiSam system protein B
MSDLSPEAIRARMAIPSTDRMRGLKDGGGFATTPEAMAAVVAASSLPPHPAPLGPSSAGPVVGAICPHDDFLYAGRVYRRALEHITAKTVVIVGTFHGYRGFASGLGTLDTRETWFAPDGPVRCSSLREAVVARAKPFVRVDDAPFDHEHSIEPIAAWLKHRDPAVEILPILPAAGGFDSVFIPAHSLASALLAEMQERGLEFGRDVAIVISADAIHYGEDFGQTRFGPGGAEAHAQARAEDLRLLRAYLEGEVGIGPMYDLLYELVDDKDPDRYRWTWCGRFAIPFGWTFLYLGALSLGKSVRATPVAYETSMSAPPLDVRIPPLGVTAPASYEHFVGYPAVEFTFAPLATGTVT